MEGSWMRLFAKKKDTKAGIPAQSQCLDEKLTSRVLDFARSVEALHTPLDVSIRLVTGCREGSGWGRSKQPMYYLLVYAADLPYAHLNAGYIAGQTLAYLRFFGISASVPHAIPAWVRPEESRSCLAAVAFGGKASQGCKEGQPEAEELPCIYHDYQERWPEEVLKYAKKRFPVSFKAVRIIRGEDRLSIVPRMTAGKKESLVQMEAGLAAARIMAAAEEMWIDLSLAETEGQNCFVSVCRSKDLTKRGRKTQERMAAGVKAVPSYI